MPSERSESRRTSTERHFSVVLGGYSRRSRSRTRARRSTGHRSPAAHRTNRRGSERRRTRKSPPRIELQARSRSRSVVISPLQRHRSRTPPTNMRGHDPKSKSRYRSHSKQNRHRLQTPCRKSSSRSRSPVRRYEQAQPVNVVNNELLECIKESLQSISSINPQSKERFTNNNVVPEFDPKSKNQTIDSWLNKVKECSEIYGWDSKQTAHYALPKLVGTAKKWYEGQPSVLLTWDEWVTKLKSAFPSYENYGHLLTEMLGKRAKFGDDLEEYYYDKLIALNRCGIVGSNAVDCIVYGIDDRSVRYGAEAVRFEDADKLLGYLRGVKHERLDKYNKKPVRSVVENSRKPMSRVLKCFNCHETGHLVPGCKKPIVKCQKCKRFGHDNPECNRSVWVDKTEVKTL
ncbi:unnamed protein product [Euphydryas editha]|uniref:CCHC-type domain-containing protein n=1 Tax=Euphydryas editha TaxID=104508 RepID=A0AAU9TGI1_EUPED|nr:unnamed protein product [Euphydryas editha]